MAKDDIKVIEYKILKYLYESIKAELDVSNIILCLSVVMRKKNMKNKSFT